MYIPLTDEGGIHWQVYPGDPLMPVLDTLKKQGFLLGDLILPQELPRTLICQPPEWDIVNRLWQTVGDVPEFRRAAHINKVREVINHAYG